MANPHTGFSPCPTSGSPSTLQVSTDTSGETPPVRRQPAAPAPVATGPGQPTVINLDDEDVQTVSSSQAASEILELIAEKKLIQKRKALAKAKAELAAEEVKELELEQQLAVSSRQSDKSRSSRRSRNNANLRHQVPGSSSMSAVAEYNVSRLRQSLSTLGDGDSTRRDTPRTVGDVQTGAPVLGVSSGWVEL